MNLGSIVDGKQVIAVVDNYYGDNGKGNVSDLLSAYFAKAWVRGTSGPDAGHTIVVDGKKSIFNLVPSGIEHDGEGVHNYIGRGVAIDLNKLSSELDTLDKQGKTYNNLKISKHAHVICSWDIERDALINSAKNNGIASTKKGVGPSYELRASRRAVKVGDIFDNDKLYSRLKKLSDDYPHLEIDIDEAIFDLTKHRDRFDSMVTNVKNLVHEHYKNGDKIGLEGAQGGLLDLFNGTYPYCTSTLCNKPGLAAGVGIDPGMIDLTLGVVKAYGTRVGNGPFLTEIGGEEYETKQKIESTLKEELEEFGIHYVVNDEGEYSYRRDHHIIKDLIRSDDSYKKSVGFRLLSGEYGATTGRPRRVGWFDTPAVKYSMMENGMDLVITKLDCLSDFGDLKICTHYSNGSEKNVAFDQDPDFLETLNAEYEVMKGFSDKDMQEKRSFDELDEDTQAYVHKLSEVTGGRIRMLSVGPEKDQKIIMP